MWASDEWARAHVNTRLNGGWSEFAHVHKEWSSSVARHNAGAFRDDIPANVSERPLTSTAARGVSPARSRAPPRAPQEPSRQHHKAYMQSAESPAEKITSSKLNLTGLLRPNC